MSLAPRPRVQVPPQPAQPVFNDRPICECEARHRRPRAGIQVRLRPSPARRGEPILQVVGQGKLGDLDASPSSPLDQLDDLSEWWERPVRLVPEFGEVLRESERLPHSRVEGEDYDRPSPDDSPHL